MQSKTPMNTLTNLRASHGLGVVAILALAVSTIALFRPTADASTVVQASPTATATVDLFAVIAGLDEYKARQQSLERNAQERQSEIEQLPAEIGGLEEDLASLEHGTDAFEMVRREPTMKSRFRELRLQTLLNWQAEDTAAMTYELFGKAATSVAEVAERDGWEIIVHGGQPMSIPPNMNLRPETAVAAVREWIDSRRVIYSSDAVDITESVIQHMNNKYAAGG